MRKYGLIFLTAIFLALTINAVSAYQYDWNYGPNSYNNDNYYTETHTINSRNTNYYYDGNGYTQRTTSSNIKTQITRYDYPRYYGSSCDRYYYSYDCNGYAPSNYRYQPVYNKRYYGNDNYYNQYYYQPRYDWNTGYYNWNY